MRTLDEKFVADWLSFQTMRPTAGLIVAGDSFRDAEGMVDREAVLILVRRLVSGWPALRMRVRPMPLGLTPPAWVPSEPDLDWHVRFLDSVPFPEIPQVLAGEHNGPLALDRPLWTLLVAALPDGDVAFVPQVQHALGDGIFALRFIDQLTADVPFDPAEATPVAPLGLSTGAFHIWQAAFSRWWGEQGGMVPAWREYRRKSLVKRLRRTGGRLVRPRRLRRQQTMPLPQRRHAFRTLDFSDVKIAARGAGCSVHDLVVAASLLAAAAIAPQPGGGAALLVPVSRRAGSTGEERNNISMTQIEIPPGSDRRQAIDAVGEQLGAFLRGNPEAVGRQLTAAGYTSYLPWRVRPRYAGQALVREVVLWPVLDPRHPFAVFTGSYRGTFSVAVSGGPEVDLDDLVSEIVRIIRGTDDAATLTPPGTEVYS